MGAQMGADWSVGVRTPFRGALRPVDFTVSVLPVFT